MSLFVVVRSCVLVVVWACVVLCRSSLAVVVHCKLLMFFVVVFFVGGVVFCVVSLTVGFVVFFSRMVYSRWCCGVCGVEF